MADTPESAASQVTPEPWGESTPLAGLSFVCLDFEGAGQRPGDHEDPVQIGLVRLGPERILRAEDCWESLLKPARPVTAAARRVHGIGNQQLMDAPTLPALWPQLKPRLHGSVLVAFGAATERRYLEGLPGQDFGPWVDLLPLIRAAFPAWPGHSLGASVENLGLVDEVCAICPGRNWHDARFDAVATAVLLRWLLARLEAALPPERVTLGSLWQPDLRGYRAARSGRSGEIR